ncbi:4Fe-4S dicluster domain-containing protein [Deltaproteobacteria bacterium TL4]
MEAKVEERQKISRRGFLVTTAAVGAAATVVSPRSLLAETEHPSLEAARKNSNVRWGFVVDLRRCVGCKACSVACKQENNVRLGVFRSEVREHVSGNYPSTKRNFVPWLCNHCENPACLENCPVDPVAAAYKFPNGKMVEYQKKATYKRPDGIVLIDQDRCVGCGNCVDDCPYGARYLDPVKPSGGDPDDNAADKCDLCVHRLEKGIVPSCVNTCGAEARIVGDLNDPNSEISKVIASNKDQIRVLLPEKKTLPQVYYIGLNVEAYRLGMDVKLEAEKAQQAS